jgi:hypothetical protein
VSKQQNSYCFDLSWRALSHFSIQLSLTSTLIAGSRHLRQFNRIFPGCCCPECNYGHHPLTPSHLATLASQIGTDTQSWNNCHLYDWFFVRTYFPRSDIQAAKKLWLVS